jgi:hypothetical protein
MTPAGNAVDPKIDAATALRRAAEILRNYRECSEILGTPEAPPSDLLHAALCETGTGAVVRFHALCMIRRAALGSPEAGDLTGFIQDMDAAELADLCERAAVQP